MPAIDRCLESLHTIELLWPSLLAAREPGTAQDASNAPPGIEQARSLRAERAEVGSAGSSVKVFAAPCDLVVVMAIESIEQMLAVAHGQMLGIQKLPRTCSRCRHPFVAHLREIRGRCTACVTCTGFRLTRVPAHAESWRQLLVDERSANAVEFRLATARREVEKTLDLIATGKLIMSSCPWCRGKNDAMPGGSLTLRAFTPGAAPETYVTCLNPTCDPPPEACGYRSEGRPFWPYEELDWLAKQLDGEIPKKRLKIKRELAADRSI